MSERDTLPASVRELVERIDHLMRLYAEAHPGTDRDSARRDVEHFLFRSVPAIRSRLLSDDSNSSST